MAFPDTSPSTSVAATTLAGNNATTAGLANSNGFDRLTYLEAIVGNLITAIPNSARIAKFTLNAGAGPLTASASDLTGAPVVSAQYSGVNGSTLTVRTAAQMIADSSLVTTSSYLLIITNTAAGTLTLTTAAGVTLTGTMTIATNTWRAFVVTVPTATTMTFQSIAIGTIS